MPRHQYAPEEVALCVLHNELLYKTCEILLSKDELVHASDIAKALNISVGYAYNLLRKLEKWRIVKGLKDPINGKLAFRLANTRVAQIIAEEIRKRKANEMEKLFLGELQL